MPDVRILVTGSRDWRQPTTIGRALEAAYADSGTRFGVTVVHGAAKGADLLAARYARQRGWNVEAHPADWPNCADECPRAERHRRVGRAGEYCPTAGHRRNDAMIRAGADVVLAFWRNHSTGTDDCVKRARVAGLTVVPYLDCACHPVGQTALFA